MRLLSLSTGSLSHLLGKEYYDFNTIVTLMNTLYSQAVIDGFEFQNIAEWDSVGPPRNEYRESSRTGARAKAWRSCFKFRIDELANSIRNTGLPILSVHANRDAGICLCAGGEEDIERAKEIINATLSLCNALKSKVAVFHFWDTWTRTIDPGLLSKTLDDYQSRYPDVKASVENIPTSVDGLTPFEIAKQFNYITLDTRWACIYDELDRYYELLPRIVNIHLRGRLVDEHWVFDSSTRTFDEVISLIRDKWRYSGLVTMEPEGGYRGARIDALVKALEELRMKLGYPSRKKPLRV
jgi:sugar phosphate isomerase/epimerase